MLVGIRANFRKHLRTISLLYLCITASLLPINGNPRSAQCGKKEATLRQSIRHTARTSLQLSHPLQQRVQCTLCLLPVSRCLVVEQRLLILQLSHLAQQLPLQLPEPPLEHLPKVARQPGIRYVRAELELWKGGRGTYSGQLNRNCGTRLQ